MNKILEIIQDGDGNASSTRVAMLLATLLVVCTWTTVSIKRNELQPLSAEHVAVVLGSTALKVMQTRNEVKSGSETRPAPTT